MGTLRAAYAYTPAAYLKNNPPPLPRKGQGTIAHSWKKNVSVRVHVHKARYEGK